MLYILGSLNYFNSLFVCTVNDSPSVSHFWPKSIILFIFLFMMQQFQKQLSASVTYIHSAQCFGPSSNADQIPRGYSFQPNVNVDRLMVHSKSLVLLRICTFSVLLYCFCLLVIFLKVITQRLLEVFDFLSSYKFSFIILSQQLDCHHFPSN